MVLFNIKMANLFIISMLGDSKLDDKDILWIWILVHIKHPLK